MNKLKIIIMSILLFTIGCGGSESESESESESDWRRSPYEYKCSEKEHIKLQNETLFCNDNTDYKNTYCYGSAIIRNCQKINLDKKPIAKPKS